MKLEKDHIVPLFQAAIEQYKSLPLSRAATFSFQLLKAANCQMPHCVPPSMTCTKRSRLDLTASLTMQAQ